jgi:hypothetical protein
MIIETSIGNRNEVAIETSLIATRFIASDEEDRSPSRVESESNTPLPAGGFETQFFHIRVARTAQRVYLRAPKMRPIRSNVVND